MITHKKRNEVVISEKEAASWIKDGMTIGIGGLLSSSHPMAIIRQLIKNKTKNLTIIAGSAGLELDLLIGAGCVRKAIISLMTGEVIATVGPMFRRAVQRGEVEIWEVDEGMYVAGLQAAGLGIPFIPSKAGVGTSYPEINPDLKIFNDPITDELLLAVPALKPDIAILHAAYSDPYGNIQHVGTGFTDRALYRAAQKVIVQVEKLVPNEEIKKNPIATSIPGADGVIRAPFGAHPGSSPGFYLEDKEHMKEYQSAASLTVKEDDPKYLGDYIGRYVHEPDSNLDYLEKIGVKRLLSLYEY